MSQTANYVAAALLGAGSTTTADTSYTQPTAGTVGIVCTAPSTGARIDNISGITLGTSVAGLARLWSCEGRAGKTVLSISSSGTTATCTTTTPHGLVTGELVTFQGAFPIGFNVVGVAITVTSTTAFTFTIPSLSNASAIELGEFSVTPATPVYNLLQEIPIIAVTGSTTLKAHQFAFDSQRDSDFLPLVLPAGHSLRVTVSTTQTNALRVTARGGSF